MDPNRIEGMGKQIKGEAKEVIGKVTGDTGQQIEGKVDKGIGKAQDAYGRAKDEVKDKLKDSQHPGNSKRPEEQRRSADEGLDFPDL
jgi:uncharacterized protein YjbJ (UPF0337 family)